VDGIIYNTHGHKLRFPLSKKAQFMTECGITLEVLMKKLLMAVLILAAFAFALAACGGTKATATPESIPAEFAGKTNPLGADAATAGAEIFKTYCLACHGEQGHGDGPAGAGLSPKPKNLPELASTVGDDFIFWRISKGVPGTSMVGWQGTLDDEEIWKVISFIHTLK
jgi:mono/diheme cytochrome c family protein